MHQNPALAGISKHVGTHGSDVFPRSWRKHQRHGISVPGQQLERNNGHDDQSGGRQRLQGLLRLLSFPPLILRFTVTNPPL